MDDNQIRTVESEKRFLKRYKKNLECIDRLELKLETLTANLSALKSPTFSDMPKGGTPRTMEDKVYDKIELEERIKNLKAKGRIIRSEILSEIDSLDNSRDCEVLEEYFIQGYTFEEIANNMGYNVKSIVRIYSRAVRDLVNK